MNSICMSSLDRRLKPFAFLAAILSIALCSNLVSAPFVSSASQEGSFPLVAKGKAAPLFVSPEDHAGVLKVAGHLRADILMVTGKEPSLFTDEAPSGEVAVIIGTLGKSPLVDQLAASGKIDASQVKGKWETFGIQAIDGPLPGVGRALVVFGSDKRGTIYGIYELSRQSGVSPWYWWADAPIQKKKELHVSPGFHTLGEPKVKYRGIFINDEAPALRNWAKENFGDLNHKFYDHVFELILRCRGNYLWPAMWLPTAFYDDDPENARLADEYGIVMASSHHEPMTRAHDEWRRFGGGEWNYETNKEQLQDFWRGGIERMGDFETVVTVGMRGDGDEAMAEEAAVGLLKTIIADQRQILEEVVGKPAAEIPQVWALYKEVQEYFERGMRVDDDILILFCDDNWGNVRILPNPEELDHPGGYGMYYHAEYVGAPVSYRWLNVSQIERIWDQMTLSYQSGIDKLWILNVGDIKPMELPMSFFLDLAWDPDAIGAADLPDYYRSWVAQQFGGEYAEDIAEMLALYTKYSSRRTPEMLKPDTYSLENYREADRVIEEYKALLSKARIIYEKLPKSHRSAYYQLVLFPIEVSCNFNEMYVAAGKNNYYAIRGAAAANYYAYKVRELFDRDAELTRIFHEDLEGGKWNHMMSQTHIGYTYWNHPPLNKTPAVSYVQVKESAELGYLLEYGKTPRWGWLDIEGDWSFSEEMPVFNRVNDSEYYIDVINRGRKALDYKINGKEDWIQLSARKGTTLFSEKVFVSIDWEKAPKGRSEGEIVISGAGSEYTVKVPINNEQMTVAGAVEESGVVAIEADQFTKATAADDASWVVVPNLGRTASAMMPSPANAPSRELGEESPSLEYTFTLLEEGEINVDTYVSPTLNYKRGEGLRFAIAIDDQEPRVININEGEEVPDWKYAPWWMEAASSRIKIKRSEHGTIDAGVHTLRVWMIDPGIVLQRFVIDAGGLKPSYLGPPASSISKGN